MSATTSGMNLGGTPAFSAFASSPEWFAAYTSPRHEKKIAEHFQMREIDHFLPLYHSARKWKDGSRVTLALPLFPSYIFVRITRDERVRVLETPGILSIVSSGKGPAPLHEFEIETMRSGLHLRNVEPYPCLAVGQRVRIIAGALNGLEGVLLRRKNQLRVVITLEHIMQSMAVEVDAADLELVKEQPGTVTLPVNMHV